MGISIRIRIASMTSTAFCLETTFQAFAKSYYSLIISVARQIVVLIPAAWLLSKTGEVTNVWWAFPIAELVSVALSLYFFKRVYDQTVRTL